MSRWRLPLPNTHAGPTSRPLPCLQLPMYQPIPSSFEREVMSLQNGQFCFTAQPEWSAYREPTFGHGVLELHNATHATWEWQRTAEYGGGAGAADRVDIAKPPAGMCGMVGARSPAPAPAPAQAATAASGAATRWAATALALGGALVVAAAWS